MNIIDDYKQGNYNFNNYLHFSIKQNHKMRKVKAFTLFSCEEALCIYLKRTLDKRYHIKYPNRTKYMHSLFDIVNALRNMNTYTIFRFDLNHAKTKYISAQNIIPQRRIKNYQR